MIFLRRLSLSEPPTQIRLKMILPETLATERLYQYQNRPIRADFIIIAAYLLRNLGLFATSVIFDALTSLNSIAVSANRLNR